MIARYVLIKLKTMDFKTSNRRRVKARAYIYNMYAAIY